MLVTGLQTGRWAVKQTNQVLPHDTFFLGERHPDRCIQDSDKCVKEIGDKEGTQEQLSGAEILQTGGRGGLGQKMTYEWGPERREGGRRETSLAYHPSHSCPCPSALLQPISPKGICPHCLRFHTSRSSTPSNMAFSPIISCTMNIFRQPPRSSVVPCHESQWTFLRSHLISQKGLTLETRGPQAPGLRPIPVHGPLGTEPHSRK